MHKLNYIKLIFFGSFLLFGFFLLLTILVLHPDSYSVALRDEGRIIQGAVYCIIAMVCFIMVIFLYHLNKQRHKEVVGQLIGYFGLMVMALLLQGIFSIIEFSIRDFQTFWTDSSLIFFIGAGFCLICFVIEVFRKGIDEGNNRKWLNALFFFTLLSETALYLNQLIDIEDWLVFIPVIFFLVFFIRYFYILIVESFALRKRLETPVEKQAFLFIGMHGILLIFVAIFAVLYSITDIFEVRYLAAVMAAIAFLSLYQGITLPMKKNRINSASN